MRVRVGVGMGVGVRVGARVGAGKWAVHVCQLARSCGTASHSPSNVAPL